MKTLHENRETMNSSSPLAMVVNDDSTQLSVLSGLVRKAGLEARAFTSAESALADMMARRATGGDSGRLPALIVTDIYMPGIDGWRFCRLLRSPEYAAFNHIPIMLVSATFAGDEASRIAADLGAEAFLPSPVDGNYFVEQVRAILSGKRTRSSVRALIVEDSRTQAALIKQTFAAHGYQADVATSVQAATDAFRETVYDVAVLDYHLPDGTGDTLLNIFRTERPDCVCLMMTTDTAPEMALDWMKRGASAYLQKPFQPGYLLELCIRARRERALLRVQDLLELRTCELRESEARFRNAMDATLDGLWDWDVPSSRVYYSPAYLGMLGYSPEELPFELKTWIDLIHPEDLTRTTAANRACVRNETQTVDTECRMRAKDGTWRWIHGRGHAVRRDVDGYALQMIGTHVDITERKQAEREREVLREQLMQAQKMESVGRLAGGLAHDFNNLLQGMLSHLDLCRDELDPGHPVRCYLDDITVNARRSADLVHQLLAYARKQTIAPRILNLNDTVASLLKMLRQLLREDLDLAWIPGADAGAVKMDPTQLDQILTNLTINARDAISGVGKLTLETRSTMLDEVFCAEHEGCRPGPFALLIVSDNGCGMDKGTLARLFEPFFTTKKVGEGTGMGLATVYGIVKQNGGSIEVQSEPGAGTTFKIYLPQFAAKVTEPMSSAAAITTTGGTETILLAEDDRSIRFTAQRVLRRFGYTVLIAEAPEAALRLAAEYSDEIHLLLTDVVMPGMSGRELATRLARQRPAVKCLFMSGHTADAISYCGVLDQDVDFLAKPFSRDELALKVREVLDRKIGTETGDIDLEG